MIKVSFNEESSSPIQTINIFFFICFWYQISSLIVLFHHNISIWKFKFKFKLA
jgi:hypothetical protein